MTIKPRADSPDSPKSNQGGAGNNDRFASPQLPVATNGNIVHYLAPQVPTVQPTIPSVNLMPSNRQSDSTNRRGDSRNRRKGSNVVDVPTVWNDLQIEQWPDDDQMRKTRV